MAHGDNTEFSKTVCAGEAAILARRYAGALYGLADEQKQLDAVVADVRGLRVLWQESADFRAVAQNPRLKRADMAQVVAQVAATTQVNKLTANFLGLLAESRRLDLIPALVDSFLEAHAKNRGEFSADVVAAQPLSAEQQDKLATKLHGMVGGKVHIQMREDKSLLGGFIVKLGSRLIDASVKGKLERLERQLKA